MHCPACSCAPFAELITSEMATNLALLIVDPQIDFTPGGSCPIPNAEGISIRIAELIASRGKDITQIYVSLDTHHRTHISNPSYWQHGDTGEQPPSWTVINSADVENEVWRPCVAANLPRALAYCEQLEAQGKASLQIWPEHCLLGTRGAACCKVVNDALQEWAGLHPTARIEYVIKGTNTQVEMFSIFEAEVRVSPALSFSLSLSLLPYIHTHVTDT